MSAKLDTIVTAYKDRDGDLWRRENDGTWTTVDAPGAVNCDHVPISSLALVLGPLTAVGWAAS